MMTAQQTPDNGQAIEKKANKRKAIDPVLVSFDDGTIPSEVNTEGVQVLRKNIFGWSNYITRLSSPEQMDTHTAYLVCRAMLRRGVAYAFLLEWQHVVSDMTQVIQMKVGDAETNTAYLFRARSYDELGENEAAIDDWTYLLNTLVKQAQVQVDANLKSLISQGYVCRGRLNSRLGNYSLAIADCERALAVDVTCAEAYSVRGRAYAHLNANEQALLDCSKAIDLQGWPVHYYRRGLVYKEIGKYDLAYKDFEQAHRSEPDNELFSQEYDITCILRFLC